MDRDWSVSLEATNLFDKLYYINKLVTAYASAQPGQPPPGRVDGPPQLLT